MGNLAKSTVTVGSMTSISRVLGFIRDMVAAQLFGASAGYDAFLVAFKIPNFMRSLFAEGAFSQAFVPLLAQHRTDLAQQEVKVFIDKVAGTLTFILLIVTLLGILGAPWIIQVFAPGFAEDVDRYTLSVSMLRITFPYLFFISLTAFAGGILNSYGRFAPPAFTPVFLNLAMIGMAIGLSSYFAVPVMALAWGVFLGGLLQLVFQFPFLARLHMLPRLKFALSDPQVKQLLKRMVPALYGVSVVQINLLLSTVFASFLITGSVSWLYYADRLMNFPLGVFGVALATVVLPHLSRQYAKRSDKAFTEILDWALRMMLLVGAPAALGLIVLSGPMIASLFQYRAFSVADVYRTQPALIAMAVGLIAYIMIKILAASFYARQDIRTPVKIATVGLGVNVGFSLLLIKPFAHVGLASALSIAAFSNALLLLIVLMRRGYYKPHAHWRKFLIQMCIANGIMVGVLFSLMPDLDVWLSHDWLWRVPRLLGLIGLGGMAYVVGLLIVGIRKSDLISPSMTLD